MTQLLFKLLDAQDWRQALDAGSYGGSKKDLDDGFIHFSTGSQLFETAEKHFSGRVDLILVAVAAERLGDRLRFEPSRNGDLFPHLYGNLDVANISWAKDFSCAICDVAETASLNCNHVD